jgi:glycosyltransferase involved in cell wall biosynthesis
MDNQKIKILLLHPDMSYGGAERQLLNLARGLANKEEYQVTVALYRVFGMLADELKMLNNIEIVDLRFNGTSYFKRVNKLRKEIKKREIDLVYSLLVGPNLLNALSTFAGSGCGIIWGNRVSSFGTYQFGFKGVLASLASKILVIRANLIIANSHAGKRHLERNGIRQSKIVVIPNGIDVSRFFPNQEFREEFRTKLRVGKEQIVIGQVGRVVEWKGHDVFLRAAARLKKINPQVVFVFIGDGEPLWLSQLRDLADELGIIDSLHWLDASRNIEYALNGIDILTVSSTSGEGFPNIIGEAMATSTAIVATDVGENGVLLQGVGLVVPRNNHGKLAEAWQLLITNPTDREHLGELAKKKVVSEYSIETMVKRTEIAFQSVVSKELKLS